MAGEPKKQKRFLFVDDDPDYLASLKEFFALASQGSWEILTAENHAQALAHLGRQSVDVVVLDFSMPVMDGLEFLRLLRRAYQGQQVVMLTSRTDEATRKSCLENGAALYLEKMLTPESFQRVFVALDALAGSTPQSGFQGMMRRVGLQEVLQMECLGRKSSVLEVFAGNTRGRIFIHDGSLIHAEAGTLEGETALYGLLAILNGEFNLQTYFDPPRRTISGHYEYLLMEAARLCDEGTRFFEPVADGTKAQPEGIPEILPGSLEMREPETGSPIQIQEILLCSGAGEVLYEHGAASVDRSLKLLKQVEQQTTQISELLSAGRFDRLEIVTDNRRVVCQIQPHMQLLMRGLREGAAKS